MAKQIRFEYDGKEYTLEFTRKSIETMERQGFIASDIADKPMTTLPALFAGAFLAHHRYVKKELVDEIYSKMTNKQDCSASLPRCIMSRFRRSWKSRKMLWET